MGLEKVKQEIIETAKKEADAIIESAESEAKAIINDAEKQMQAREKSQEEDIEKSAELLKKRETASTELELQKRGLSLKNELINNAFLEARRKIGQLSDKKRESHVKSLMEQAANELTVSVVICAPKDAKFIHCRTIKVVDDNSILGGIIAESSDGRLRVDYSYDTLLQQVKSKVLSDVARTLLGK
jgi:V/A-type H+/Na+-transporting ATPase subunit E